MADRKPWYARTSTIISVVLLLLLALWLIPPFVASPTSSGLNAQGDQERSRGGWKEETLSDNPLTLAGGIIFLDSRQYVKGQTAAYTTSTIKIDLNLPRFIVEPLLHGRIVGVMKERGFEVDESSETKTDYDENGESGTLYTQTGTIKGSYGQLPTGVPANSFIAIWRCSWTGSWGVAVGVAAQGSGSNGGFPVLPGQGLSPKADLDDMRNKFLPNTVCGA